jgi:vesicle-fusing ATPase
VFAVNFQKATHIVTIDRILGSDSGFLAEETKIETFASGDQQIRLKSTKSANKNVFTANFSMGNLGIGGLDEELTNLFRRAFASRRLPHMIIEKFGIKHVKGILLYGPPGTGKTLIARQLAKSLNAKSLQIVNGP